LTRIKICGITDEETAREAAVAGADFLGLVFASSRRHVSLEQGKRLARVIHAVKAGPSVVGVFVNTPAKEVNRIASLCQLDWVQLSGDEDLEYCRVIEKPLINVIHVRPDMKAEEVIKEIDMWYRHYSSDRLIFLLDAHCVDAYGGSGQTFNRDIACKVSKEFPVIVAGGLTPENVGELVHDCQPWGVDVSSGVESHGRKDILKIRVFIANARAAEGKPA
jgi:phosphoribosylanthranilate isomerase